MSEVTVIVSVRAEAAADLARSVLSVAGQTSSSWQATVVHGGHPDLMAAAADLAAGDPRIAGADDVETALASSSAPIVAFLQSGARYPSDYLQRIGSAFAAVNCSTFPNNTVVGSVNDDVVAIGYSCTIAAGAFVNGNVLQTGPGNLVIRGTVNGAVEESGDGSITIARGIIGGSVSEADLGSVTVRGGSSIGGSIEESGDGGVSITVDLPGVVNADVLESGNGSVTVNASVGSFEGSVIETGGGNVSVTVAAGHSFKGGIEEYDGGSVSALVNGFFEGNIMELAAGNVTTSGPGTFKGNSEHELAGTCTNTIVDFQGAACNLL